VSVEELVKSVESWITGSFSLIACVILSAGAMLIFSVSFQIDQMPEGNWFPKIPKPAEANMERSWL